MFGDIIGFARRVASDCRAADARVRRVGGIERESSIRHLARRGDGTKGQPAVVRKHGDHRTRKSIDAVAECDHDFRTDVIRCLLIYF